MYVRNLSAALNTKTMSVCIVESDVELFQVITDDVIVYFTTMWCGPCREISPHYARAAEQYPNFKFAKVDVGYLEDTRDVSTIPTFRVYRGGEVVEELLGADLGALDSLLKKHCSFN